MLDIMEIGRKISEKRREKNITQSELADTLYVSAQAVSNWERGKSMPDITKFPELCEILGLTAEELIGRESKMVESIKDNKFDEYLEQDVDIKELANDIADMASIIKPREIEKISNKIGDKFENELDTDEFEKMLEDVVNIFDLIFILPRPTVGKIVKKMIMKGKEFKSPNKIGPCVDSNDWCDIFEEALAAGVKVNDFEKFVPYCNRERVSDIVLKYYEAGRVNRIISVAPFISREALDKIALDKMKKIGDIGNLSSLAPFLSQKVLEEVAIGYMEEKKMYSLVGIAPFLTKETLDKIALNKMEQNDDMGSLAGIAPFLSREVLDKVALHQMEQNKLYAIASIAPFVSREVLDEIALKKMEQSGYIGNLAGIAPFVSQKVLDKIALHKLEKNQLHEIAGIAPFLSREVISQIAETSLERGGAEASAGLASIAPFLNKETVGKMARLEYEKNGMKGLGAIASFMDRATLTNLAQEEYEKNGMEDLAAVAPFIDRNILTGLAEKSVKEHGLSSISAILPFVNQKRLKEYIESIIR